MATENTNNYFTLDHFDRSFVDENEIDFVELIFELVFAFTLRDYCDREHNSGQFFQPFAENLVAFKFRGII